jgi:hypothetical protein
MMSYLDKLNLRPQEKRIIVSVAIVVFIAVNVIWVRPQFGKVSFWEVKRIDAEKKLRTYTNEIAQVKIYTNELAALQKEGLSVGEDDPTLMLQQTVSAIAGANGVPIESISPIAPTATKTNSMFEEAGVRITITAMESNLVEFLYALGSRGTLIRLRTMSLQPDPSQVRLRGNLEFVQSFLKKPVAVKPGTPLALAPRSGAKPGSATPAKTGTNAVAGKPATNAPPAEGNWFKRLISKITGSGSSTPKPAATTNTPAKPSGKPASTNKPPAPPAPK